MFHVKHFKNKNGGDKMDIFETKTLKCVCDNGYLYIDGFGEIETFELSNNQYGLCFIHAGHIYLIDTTKNLPDDGEYVENVTIMKLL